MSNQDQSQPSKTASTYEEPFAPLSGTKEESIVTTAFHIIQRALLILERIPIILVRSPLR